MELFAQQLADQLTASGYAAVESIEIGPGLRPWGEQTATVTYRIDGALAFGERAGAIPDANALGRQVVLLSPRPRDFSYRYLRRMGRVSPMVGALDA